MDYTQAKSSAPVVLTEFYASWCPHCRRMAPAMDQIEELIQGSAKVYRLDIDLNKELADIEHIESLPTFIIYRDGQERWRSSGEMDAQLLLSKVESLI